MRIIQSPERLPEDRIDLFLAGGISGCPNWQTEAATLLQGAPGIAVNPRRIGDLAWDGAEAREQIAWEHAALQRAHAVLFWFPCETLCPITLLELGAAMYRTPSPALFVGTHPDYQRRFDVVQQLNLQRKEVAVRSSLHDVVQDYIASTLHI